MYKLYLFKTDGHKAEYEYKSKPTFDDLPLCIKPAIPHIFFLSKI